MKIIKINYNDLENTIKCYQNSINTLEENLNKINQDFNNLKESWKGESKEVFFNNIYINFQKSMQLDINHLKFLKQQLQMVRNNFQAVENQYKNLKL